MEAQEDRHDLASDVSGLSSLENDAEDEFEKLMIQNVRDEQRLSQAVRGKVDVFRKARTYARDGLTMDNLERNNARNYTLSGPAAHVKFQSPPSSSGSTRSDPAIHAPPTWGRKSRLNRNWMRTITREDAGQQTPGPADDTINSDTAQDANAPRDSIEDSPLSRKSSIYGTPRNDASADWDLTFELNEASMIASTPYIPRNTALDDIRRREMNSQMGDTRQDSPESERPLRPTSSDQERQRLRKRTNSWQSIGKSRPVTGIGMENSPIAVYKSAETAGTVKHDATFGTPNERPKSLSHRREDSQDLLRRLARASNTPSPARVAAARPQTAPAGQASSSMQAMPPSALSNSLSNIEPVGNVPVPNDNKEPLKISLETQNKAKVPSEASRDTEHVSASPSRPLAEVEDVDVTPLPAVPSSFHMKTPVVTGAWIDTPGPRTLRRPIHTSGMSRQSPEKKKSTKGLLAEKSSALPANEALADVAAESIRPLLPSSALHALVQEAKANGRRQSGDFGDSTINSLEDLIAPLAESGAAGMDEDTLQGLQLPTGTPRNEAERQRQQEVVHLHRMNERLRAARTSIRDASRGMKRVEDQVEHVDEGEVNGEGVKVVYRNCACMANGGHGFSLGQWGKSLFWQKRLKMERQTSNSRWKMWGGLTGLGIFMLVGFVWWVSEGVACEMYCHHMYAQSSPYPFSVNMDAPEYPFVIPTLIYRNLIKAWWAPLYSFVSLICTTAFKSMFSFNEVTRQFVVGSAARVPASQTGADIWLGNNRQAAQVTEESEWDLRMGDDQLLHDQG